MSDDLLVERRGAILVVTLNRPDARNAFSASMLKGAHDAWHELDEDPSLRVGVLTGAGGNFCSGMDLKALGEMDVAPSDADITPEGHASDPLEIAWHALLRHFRPSKPIVAAVEGYCVAGGTEILQATELRVAAASAKFAIAEVRRGLFPLGGSTVRLQRQIPFTMAADLLLTGRMIDADEARQIGLVGHVVPDGQALDKALELAEAIAENGPLAVQAVLASMRATRDLSESDGLAKELELGFAVFATNDAKEGPRAFAEKRNPEFTGT
ncbi:MAG: crotonase/enoyl-CoA hydratase family protein [Actinobacteria bacterium]|nr:crotonase/enoyl-CoA hydratase family protein [Actinomycetota bacterium]